MATLLDADNEEFTVDVEIAEDVDDYWFGGDGFYDAGYNRWFCRNDAVLGKVIETLVPTATGGDTPGASSYVVMDHITETAVSEGQTWYLGYFHKVTRISGVDVWHLTDQSGDKGLELNGAGCRWEMAMGSWSCFTTDNTAGRYTQWVGNPAGGGSGGHLNSGLEVDDAYRPNQNGYSASNPLQLEYERWYAWVLELKVAWSGATGRMQCYINGTKTHDYQNILTWDNTGTKTISGATWGGTIAQPAYDCPTHYRRLDRIMITDSLAAIEAAGLMADPEAGGGGGGRTLSSGRVASSGRVISGARSLSSGRTLHP